MFQNLVVSVRLNLEIEVLSLFYRMRDDLFDCRIDSHCDSLVAVVRRLHGAFLSVSDEVALCLIR